MKLKQSPVCSWVMIIFSWNHILRFFVYINLNTHSLQFQQWFGVPSVIAAICWQWLLPWSQGSDHCVYSSSFGFGAWPSLIELTIYKKTDIHTHMYNVHTHMYNVHARIHTTNKILYLNTHTHTHTHSGNSRRQPGSAATTNMDDSSTTDSSLLPPGTGVPHGPWRIDYTPTGWRSGRWIEIVCLFQIPRS